MTLIGLEAGPAPIVNAAILRQYVVNGWRPTTSSVVSEDMVLLQYGGSESCDVVLTI